jgi:hypothetical protein
VVFAGSEVGKQTHAFSKLFARARH